MKAQIDKATQNQIAEIAALRAVLLELMPQVIETCANASQIAAGLERAMKYTGPSIAKKMQAGISGEIYEAIGRLRK